MYNNIYVQAQNLNKIVAVGIYLQLASRTKIRIHTIFIKEIL